MTRLLAIAFGAGLALLGCAKTTDESGLGTNTNWLAECASDDECSGDAQCLCGVCTKPCTQSAQCGEVDDGTTCEALDPYAACGGVSVAKACVQRCEESSDCTALDDPQCEDGLCVPDRPPVAGAGGPPPFDGGAPRSDGSVPLEPSYALSRQGAAVVITDVYRECNQHTDCVLVDSTCNGCCNRDAIESALESTYLANHAVTCADYQGGFCDCEWKDQVARCVEGRCAAPLRETVECFAPGHNEDQAYQLDAVGCVCEAREAMLCSDQTSITCAEHSGGHYAWFTFEDGRCGETLSEEDPACGDGQVYEDSASCVAARVFCYVMPTGEYCGKD